MRECAWAESVWRESQTLLREASKRRWGDALDPGAAIRTDGWNGYENVAALGYTHEVIRATGEVGEDLLTHCHQVASLLKRWMLGTHQGAIRHEHLDYYLDEFTFRFNRRTSRYRGKLFYRLVQQTVGVEPTPYKDMVKHVRGRKSHELNS